MDTTWKVLAHRPIEEITQRVWRVEGTLPGMALKRVMTVARLESGELVVHNPIALDDDSMKRLEGWGEVGFIVVPNGYHRLDAPRFAARYPKAKVLCPPAARGRVAKVVGVHGDYAALPRDPHVTLERLEGTADREGIMTIREEAGSTVVFNDAIFNMPDVAGFAGWMLRNVTQSTGGPRVSRIARLFLIADTKSFGAHVRRIADTERLARVIVSHHRTIDDEPADVLRGVASSIGA